MLWYKVLCLSPLVLHHLLLLDVRMELDLFEEGNKRRFFSNANKRENNVTVINKAT